MDHEKKIEIPFGAFDSELIRQEINIPNGFKAVIDGNKIILTRAESEDERIRKEIIAWLKNSEGQTLPIDRYNAALAWLEKQGNESVNIDIESMVSSYEQRVVSQCNGVRNNPIVNMCVSAFRHGIENTLDELNLKRLEKQGEQKVNYTTLVETGNGGINALVTGELSTNDYEEKPATWSREDEQNLNAALSYIRDEYLSRWLKDAIYNKYEKPAEWSEEDTVRLQRIIDFLWHNRKGDTDTIYQQEQDIDWLKSLKQRIGG